jgi:hypothetical protein
MAKPIAAAALNLVEVPGVETNGSANLVPA